MGKVSPHRWGVFEKRQSGWWLWKRTTNHLLYRAKTEGAAKSACYGIPGRSYRRLTDAERG